MVKNIEEIKLKLAIPEDLTLPEKATKSGTGLSLDDLSPVKEDAKGKGIRKTVDFEITDESLIPGEYLKVDEVKIRADAKQGVEIPGIRLFWKTSVQ